MADKQQSMEEKLQDSLEDFVLIAQKLTPYCSNIQDMVEMLELATKNSAQLRMLIQIMQSNKR